MRFQKASGSKNKGIEKENSLNPESSTLETVSIPHSLSPPGEVNFPETVIRDEQTQHAYSVVVSTSSHAEGAIEAHSDVTEVVQPLTVTQFASKLTDEEAVTKIQTAFRGYLVYFYLSACSSSLLFNGICSVSKNSVQPKHIKTRSRYLTN